jgi:hypothetical protein
MGRKISVTEQKTDLGLPGTGWDTERVYPACIYLWDPVFDWNGPVFIPFYLYGIGPIVLAIRPN